MKKCILQRLEISKMKDSKGEHTTIGKFQVFDENNKVIFESFSGENGSQSSDESGKDHRIMPRTYKLKWCFTKTSVAKVGFRNVNFNDWKNIIESRYHERFLKYGFKNVGLLLWTPELPSFESRCIFIHIMNTGKDVDGCVGLGYNKNNAGILSSTQAIQDFYNLVKKEGVENFELLLKE